MEQDRRPSPRKIVTAPPVVAPTDNLPVTRVNEVVVPRLDRQQIAQLGARTMERATGVSQRITSAARAAELGDLGKSLGDLVTVAREYDPASWNKGLIGKLFRVGAKQLDTRIKTVDQNVNTLLGICRNEISKFRMQAGDLDDLQRENEAMIDQLNNDIAAGEAELTHAEANVPQLTDPNDAMQAQLIAEYKTDIAFLQKRIDDLKRQQTLGMLMRVQITQLRDNSFMLEQKFESTIALTIPALQQQYSMYIIQEQQRKGAEISKKIDDATDEAIRRNATALRQNSVAINTAMARSVISVDTLKMATQEVVAGINEVNQIRQDMITRIKSEDAQIKAITQEINRAQAH